MDCLLNDRVSKRFEIKKTDEAREAARLCRTWRQSVADAPRGSIYLHPDWVLASDADRDSYVYLRPHPDDSAHAFECLAVFRSGWVHLGHRPRLPWLLSLQSLKLVSDQVLGATDEASTRCLVGDLVRWLQSGETKADCILFEDVEVDSVLWKCLKEVDRQRTALTYCPSPPQPHCLIDFPDPSTDYWKRFSGKTWYDVRSKARNLEHRLVHYARPEEVPEFLAKAQEISRRSWQGKRFGLRMKDSPEARRTCDFLANHGALRSYILETRGKPVAFEFGVQWNGCFLFEETGYDLAHSDQSPGTVLMYRVLQDLVERDPPSLCDFGAGDAAYKRFYSTRQTASGPVLLVRRGLRPYTVLSLQKLGRSLGRSVRTCLKAAGLDSYVRAAYRK